jgi:hypothetical protein
MGNGSRSRILRSLERPFLALLRLVSGGAIVPSVARGSASG